MRAATSSTCAPNSATWEFPGGKLKPNEAPFEGLCRELKEELGIAVHGAEPVIAYPHDYPDRRVLLDLWRITHYEGLDRLLAEYGEHVAALELLPVGAPRRDWRATTISDGMVIVRHAELPKAMEMAQRFAAELHLFAS